jgi:E3 ubiquitin-protein ligase SHPRH
MGRYFRQLQELSDSVAEVAWQGRLQDAKEACIVEQNDIEDRIKTNRARQRYLVHLAKNVEDGTVDEDDETCILCRCEFARGFITPW